LLKSLLHRVRKGAWFVAIRAGGFRWD
jgi:hypothetical protein